MDNEQLKKFVNKIFTKKGYPPVKNFGKEFADGSRYFLTFYTNYSFVPTFIQSNV